MCSPGLCMYLVYSFGFPCAWILLPSTFHNKDERRYELCSKIMYICMGPFWYFLLMIKWYNVNSSTTSCTFSLRLIFKVLSSYYTQFYYDLEFQVQLPPRANRRHNVKIFGHALEGFPFLLSTPYNMAPIVSSSGLWKWQGVRVRVRVKGVKVPAQH